MSKLIYLDNAATTFPKPRQVYEAVLDCMENYGANPGRAGHKLAMRAGIEIYECRENIAKLLNVSNPMSIVFTHNATDSLNLAIKGVVKSGDHIITTSIEHNSVIRPIKALEKNGVENTIVKCDRYGHLDPNDIKKAIKPNTKLIVTTHASNVCGTIEDKESDGNIAKENNILYLVDASQTLGVYDIDIQKINVDMNKYQDVCDAIFEGLIKNDKALEINTSGLFMDMKDTLPNISFVKRYKKLGGRYITVGSDSHYANRVCQGIEQGLDIARAAGFDSVTVFENRQPRLITIE